MDQQIIRVLNEGGIGVIPTDTLYGLIGKALDPQAVERIYQVKGRKPDKPCIILISSLSCLELFNIQITDQIKSSLEKIWPNPVSIILPCPDNDFAYLHRGTNTLAFRIPNKQDLLNLIKQTGPLVSPSANPEGYPVAQNIQEAKNYFGDKVDFYINGGTLTNPPSTLIQIQDRNIKILRDGAFKFKA